MNISDRERAARKVMIVGDCWLWMGSVGSNGYGNFWIDGTAKSAHRLFYVWAKGPIPRGLQIDHLCRNKMCVNPEHMEAVTPRENVARHHRASKPVCPRCGRDYDRTSKQGWRRCSACIAKRHRDAGLASRPRCGCGRDFDYVDSAGRRRCVVCSRKSGG